MDPQSVPANVQNPAPAPQSPTGTSAPWPGAFGLYKYSKSAVKLNLNANLVLYLSSIFVSGILTLILGVAGRFLGEVVTVILTMGLFTSYLAGARNQQLSLGQVLSKCSPILALKFLVSVFFIGIALGFSLLLLVVPFFIVLPRVILAPYFLIDRNLGPFAAINASWEATKGYVGKIWGVLGATLGMGLLAVTIIGIPFSLYFLFMYAAALALTYEYITRGQTASTAAPDDTAGVPPAPIASPVSPPAPQPQVVQPAPLSGASNDTPPPPVPPIGA